MHRPHSLRPDDGAAALALMAMLLSCVPGCGGKASSIEPAAMGVSNPRDESPALPAPPVQAPVRQETCEDNPLLSGCTEPPSAATCPENPLACPIVPEPPSSLPAPSRRSEDLSLPYVVRMEALLDEECGICHGAAARSSCTGLCPGMTYIDDMPRLLDEGKLIPCDWQASPLGRRVRDSSMPPPPSGLPPMRIGAQQQLEVFVENMCSELLSPGNSERGAVRQLLLESCGGCHALPAADAGPPPGGLARIDDVAALLDDGSLIPCRAQSSPLVIAIQNGRMPPPESGLPPVSAEQLATLIAFVDGPCAR